jgi:hypothetical protein
VELGDGAFWVDVDHMNVDLSPVWVGIDEGRVEAHRIDVDRLVLRPFELALEAVASNDICIAR